MKRSVLRQLNTERKEILCGAGVGEDCAIFSFSEGENMASCVQEAPVAVTDEVLVQGPGEPVITLPQLIQKCANNLVVKGAEPVAVMIALILPETGEEPELKEMMAAAKDKCKELSMDIAGGQTRVSAAVHMPVAVVTGYGKISSGSRQGDEEVSGNQTKAAGGKGYSIKAVKPGQDVVISKWIGLQGTAIVAKRNRESLIGRYPAYFVDEACGFDRYLSIIPEAATAMKSGVCAMHDASEGGIFATLWELAEGAGVGLNIDLKKLPLRQETVEVCEHCNVNPYELLSGGCLVMTTEDGQALVTALEEEGIPAVVVGKVTDSKDRILVNEDEIRYMDKPKQDEIYREII